MKTNSIKTINQVPLVCLALLAPNVWAIEPELIFSFPSQGTKPVAELVQGPDGNFYGTTSEGGNLDKGTVYRVAANGTITTLVSFDGTNGMNPQAGLTFGDDGALYGTTPSGGVGFGTVFKVTTNGVLTTLFTSENGLQPKARLTRGNDGNFYGTASYGAGVVFKVTPNGTLTTLASFDVTNGMSPVAALVLGNDGNFYGTASSGGDQLENYGTVFRVTTNGILTRLVAFNFVNGASPQAALTLGGDGNFYGTTFDGGIYDHPNRVNGTVFRVTTNGTLTTLHSFDNNNDSGWGPSAALTLAADGSLYGSTQGGGLAGWGTLFRVTTNGALTTLASFAGNGGGIPQAALTLATDGNFYGTTFAGGTATAGTVFKLTANGNLSSLASFSRWPIGVIGDAHLTLGSDGSFYGTTPEGGKFGLGTVFRVTTYGALTSLASFANTNGANPQAGLTLGKDGSCYGNTSGGPGGRGTVFRVTTNGTVSMLASFLSITNGNPHTPMTLGPDGNFYGTAATDIMYKVTTNGTLTRFNQSGLAKDLTLGNDGNFYGTTHSGGLAAKGSVLKITTNGALITLASFSGINGSHPYDALTLGSDGAFYGTTPEGGAFPGPDEYGLGTVFRVTTNGTLTSLASFAGTNGANPYAGLTLGLDGNYYGTTRGGGTYYSPPAFEYGYGTVFKVTTNGTLTMLASFSGTNVMYPQSRLTLGPDGHFYGVTGQGSGDGFGAIFRIRVPGGGIRLTILPDGAGGLFIRHSGAPNVTYRLQRASSLTGPWSDVATNTAPVSGLIQYHETTSPLSQAFYRTVQP